MDIQQRIKERRKACKLTQEDVAGLLGVSIMTIRRWEWGQQVPTADVLPKLAAALNTTVGYLMGIEDNPERASSSEKPNCSPEPALQTAHESETVHTTGRLIYEWGKDNRLDLPDTPENRAMLAEVLKEAMAGKRENINA